MMYWYIVPLSWSTWQVFRWSFVSFMPTRYLSRSENIPLPSYKLSFLGTLLVRAKKKWTQARSNLLLNGLNPPVPSTLSNFLECETIATGLSIITQGLHLYLLTCYVNIKHRCRAWPSRTLLLH